MALPLGVDRAVWRIFAVNAFKQGWSFNYSLRAFRDMGFGVQRGWALGQFRSVNNLLLGWKQTLAVKPDVLFPQKTMIEEDLKRNYKYFLHGQATILDKETGATYTKNVSFYTDKWQSKEGWRDTFLGQFWGDYEEEEEEIINVEWTGVQHNAGMSY